MGIIAAIPYYALVIYFYVLVGRFVIDLIQSLNPTWRPRGILVIPAGIVVTVTDPPLKFLRRFIKPIQFGVISLDLAWTVLFIMVIILRDIMRGLIG